MTEIPPAVFTKGKLHVNAGWSSSCPPLGTEALVVVVVVVVVLVVLVVLVSVTGREREGEGEGEGERKEEEEEDGGRRHITRGREFKGLLSWASV
ncbi:hypothetical protein E2C01_095007 [Portunus trituberculatus]|uniref:Uncharacterized protein n=1 Tax=Portunus trituberculatus TaxID=210409 RepID=A0A5B7K4M8_PORTR|nr:hypothetical protein [Portunus trituberculatus]